MLWANYGDFNIKQMVQAICQSELMKFFIKLHTAIGCCVDD
jgi:hypothetical protein